MYEGAGKLESALHPARQGGRATIARLGEIDELEHLLDERAAPPRWNAEQCSHELDVLFCRQIRVEHEQLGHVADALTRAPPEVLRVLIQDANDPGVGSDGAGHESDRCGLACAAGSDDADDATFLDSERDVVEGDDIAEACD